MNEQAYMAGFEPAEESLEQRARFTASWQELMAAGLLYAAAYLYARALVPWDGFWLLLPAAALLIAATELLHWKTRRSWESFVWLGCFLLCTVSVAFGLHRVWRGDQALLFVHIFAVWWVLSRSGRLLEGKSGHLLPLDAVNGLLLLPFGGFFLRLRTLWWGLRQLGKPAGDKAALRRSLWMLGAAAACLLLFAGAARLLIQADAGFSALLERLAPLLRWRLNRAVWIYLLVSLPVGAWLFGLIDGARRQSPETLETRRAGAMDLLEKLQKVPGGFWTAVVGLFSALYLAFFLVQGRYLFGAFTRTLPEGFIVSEYARQGFFELCKVMAVNFTLLWLVTRLATPEARSQRRFTAACLALLAESAVFAVIAMSKLWLYISCFGFTPLRLQSSWLVWVLLAGCVLWARNLLTGRPGFRKWMVFGAVTLSALALM